ncbi:MAG: hypothetical protein RRB13_00630 [bacterium]|nr:hypothetical protein [bacterium]
MAFKTSDNSPIRWMRIATRTAHIASISLFLGGVWFGVSDAVLMPYFLAVVLTGATLTGLFFLGSGNWLVQNRGLVILTKLFLIVQLPFLESWRVPILGFILVVSSLISHAPGSIRYYSIWHRRRVG